MSHHTFTLSQVFNEILGENYNRSLPNFDVKKCLYPIKRVSPNYF